MDGWMDGWMEEWRMNRHMNGWIDEWMNVKITINETEKDLPTATIILAPVIVSSLPLLLTC